MSCKEQGCLCCTTIINHIMSSRTGSCKAIIFAINLTVNIIQWLHFDGVAGAGAFKIAGLIAQIM